MSNAKRIGDALRRGWQSLSWKGILGVVAGAIVLAIALYFFVKWTLVRLLENIVELGKEAMKGNHDALPGLVGSVFMAYLLVMVILSPLLVIDEFRKWWMKLFGVVGIAVAAGALWVGAQNMFATHPLLLSMVGTGLLVGAIAGAALVFASDVQWLKWIGGFSMSLVSVAFVLLLVLTMLAAACRWGKRALTEVTEDKPEPVTVTSSTPATSTTTPSTLPGYPCTFCRDKVTPTCFPGKLVGENAFEIRSPEHGTGALFNWTHGVRGRWIQEYPPDSGEFTLPKVSEGKWEGEHWSTGKPPVYTVLQCR